MRPTRDSRLRHGEDSARLDAIRAGRLATIAASSVLVLGFTGIAPRHRQGLAHGLAVPTSDLDRRALLEAGRRRRERSTGAFASRPTDRVPVVSAPDPSHGHVTARRLAVGEEPVLPAGTTLVPVDLVGRASTAADELGATARAGLAAALLRLGAERVAGGDVDEAATLVPEYVTLPRGVEREAGQVTVGRV
jgi:hypothetical protein